jgi:hypothetical protein
MMGIKIDTGKWSARVVSVAIDAHWHRQNMLLQGIGGFE